MNEAGNEDCPNLDMETLAREGQLALFAGADTTDTTESNTLVFLISHPAVLARLRAELDAAAGEGAPYDQVIEDEKLVNSQYLHAVINEAMRLQPAVPNGVQRLPPVDGKSVVVAGQ